MRRPRALPGCTRGTAAVEFAIISVVLIGLLVATIDFGRTYYVKNQISWLADQAARRILINPAISDTEVESDLRNAFTAGDPDQLTVSIATESSGDETYRVLTVGFPVTLFIPQLDSRTVALSVRRRVPVS